MALAARRVRHLAPRTLSAASTHVAPGNAHVHACLPTHTCMHSFQAPNAVQPRSPPGNESHAGQVFTCIGALSLAGALGRCDGDLVAWWLAERQTRSGGLNGRPEKLQDVCYSWWCASCLALLGRLHWVDGGALTRFILWCQVGGAGRRRRRRRPPASCELPPGRPPCEWSLHLQHIRADMPTRQRTP